MAITTKDAALSVVVESLQTFVENATDLAPAHVASIYWHLGRLDVLQRFSGAFPLETIGLYLHEANDALDAARS